jgi:hypothetical protein
MRHLPSEIASVKARIAQIKKTQKKLAPDEVDYYTNRLELESLTEDLKELQQLDMITEELHA